MNCVESKTEALSRSCQKALYIASNGADAIEEIRDKMGDPLLAACFTLEIRVDRACKCISERLAHV